MSLISAIKHRLGLSVTTANNFVLDASADNGTMKLARESGQDIMTVDAAGKVAFPQGGGQAAAAGYIKFPVWLGGLIIQWGVVGVAVTQGPSNGAYFGTITTTFAVPFSSTGYYVGLTYQDGVFAGYAPGWQSKSTGQVQILAKATAATGNINVGWIAIGY